MSKKGNNSTSVWVIIGVIVMIVLILLWQFDAFSTGDTDVSAPLTFLGNVANMINFA